MNEDRVADAVTDVGSDVIGQLRRISDDLSSIRAWVGFLGGLVVVWLILGVVAAVFVAVLFAAR